MPVIINQEYVHAFATSGALERWMHANYDSVPELWLKIHKKASGLPTVTYAEALDVALCFGWIDGISKSFDDTSFLQRFTPRRARSIWSIINTAHIARLTKDGRMQPAGMAQVEAAKADGRWDKAYGGAKIMTTPDALMRAIDAIATARATYDTLSSQNRYALAFRLNNIKTEAARARRIAEFVAMLSRGETLYPNGKTSSVRAEGKTKAQPVPEKNAAVRSSAKTAPVGKKAAEKTVKKSAKKTVKKLAKPGATKVGKKVVRKMAKKS